MSTSTTKPPAPPPAFKGYGHLWRPAYHARTLCPGTATAAADGWRCDYCGGRGKGEPPASHRERKKERVWWFKVTYAGQRYKMSTKAYDLAVAEEFRRGFLTKLWGGRLPWEPWREPTFAEVLERGIAKAEARGRRSVKSMRLAAARLLGVKAFPPTGQASRDTPATARLRKLWARMEAVKLGGGAGMPASGATEEAIDAYIAARLAQGYEPATVNLDLAMLKRSYRVAYRTVDRTGRSMVARVPHIEMVEVNNVRQGFFTEAEYQAIRAQLTWCLPNLLTFYRVTGYRNREPLTLTWAQVDFENGRLRIDPKDTKSKKWRADWPFAKHPELARVIAEQWVLKGKVEHERGVAVQHVFFWRDGRPIKDWRDAWEKARTAAGLPNKLIHDFRRTAYSDLIRTRVVDPKTARRLIGAKTSSIGDRYHIVLEDDEAAAAAALGHFHAENAPKPPAAGTGRRVLPFSGRRA